MTGAGRYLRLLGVQLRASLATSMQYRVDFLIEGAMSIWWLGWNLVPLLILYEMSVWLSVLMERRWDRGWDEDYAEAGW